MKFKMYYVKGKTTNNQSTTYYTTYRSIFFTDTSGGNTDCTHGMSGSPVVDTNGNVIGIFTGSTTNDDPYPIRGIVISFDKYLYQKLKSYE